MNKPELKFQQFLSIVFVLFSLYLMHDAFYRWDGFSYYAPFAEFLPSLSLAFILLNLVAVIVAFIIWAVFKLVGLLGNKAGIEISSDKQLLALSLLVLLGGLFWQIKRIIWPDVQTSMLVKLSVLCFAALLSVCLTWLLRKRVGSILGAVLSRITPLVWIFGALLVLSVPTVIYTSWTESPDNNTLKQAGSESDTKGRPNIILLTYDALAAREMSLYGYHRDTTPYINRWSEKATVFTRAEAASNFTTPAAASLITGKRVWTHQTYHIAGAKPVRSDVESLPAVLRDKGYFNLAFVVNPFASVRVLGIEDSFDLAPLTSEFGDSDELFGWKFGVVDRMLYSAFGDRIRKHDWILKNDFILGKFLNLFSRNITQTTVPPEIVFDRFLKVLDGKLPEPYFAWLHIFPPHDPYLPPGKFADNNSSSRLGNYKSQEKLIEESYKYLFQYADIPGTMRDDVHLMRDYYDEFISYIDSGFNDFMTELSQRQVDNTLIVLTSDHGESFDHGYFTHGGPFLYEQVTNIPLVIKEPGQENGKTVESLVEQIDIPATIMALADIPVPSWMEGRSLVPLIAGDVLPPRPAFSMNFEGNRSRGHKISNGSIAVWEGNYKLIHYLQKNESLLYNIQRDPDELDDLIDKDPAKAEHLLNVLKKELDAANSRIVAAD